MFEQQGWRAMARRCEFCERPENEKYEGSPATPGRRERRSITHPSRSS